MSDVKVLVLAQHDNQSLASETLTTLGAAKMLLDHADSGTIDLLVIGNECNSVVEQSQKLPLINQVLVADDDNYQAQLAENLAPAVKAIASDYSHLLTAANSFGKDLLPRVAALLDVEMLADVIVIESLDTVVRPIYAGNALARVQSDDPIKLISVRSSAFEALSAQGGDQAEIVKLDSQFVCSKTQLVNRESQQSERPELANASVVISGGRGVGSQENFALIETLADKLGGAVGASRAAVDAGFVTNDLQVGQTGKIVAPSLYIAVGISGAIQHLAGMKESKVIVAINSDPDAPIFEIADYALVGDLFEILPELIDSV